jgi:CTP:molybdopterin cytidylyltransferase MocA
VIAALEPGIDVVFPVRAGIPGHPVAFSARARGFVAALPDGDRLSDLRDDSRLERRTLPVEDEGAFADIDTEEDYRRVVRRAGG